MLKYFKIGTADLNCIEMGYSRVRLYDRDLKRISSPISPYERMIIANVSDSKPTELGI